MSDILNQSVTLRDGKLLDEPVISRRPVRYGEPCPVCGEGPLDYNGMLDLECPQCGFTEGPGGGCT